MIKKMIKWLEWRSWWRDLKKVAKEMDWPVNKDDPESWRDLFEDGYSPSDAVIEDMSCAD